MPAKHLNKDDGTPVQIERAKSCLRGEIKLSNTELKLLLDAMLLERYIVESAMSRFNRKIDGVVRAIEARNGI